ncbi:UDP-N-acetylmuramate--L-alanine ligase [Parabacteroides sp. FAFU027]|uniref:UDP-N-acetylmuramate--L-alanine ligase n=1 Tax=Parabacteroides sp. FAFU027 TaxID=2922715 RepID=UPI001FB03E0C|nr:UDP-N-acetylmuramate--L-alanine ligase [Parabacteroides sp. FAFU027]
MKSLKDIKSVYFVGAGGIGMSALVRYFLAKGKKVAGYDKTATELTAQLIKEGADIHYEDNCSLIPAYCLEKETTLVVLTPAVPHDHSELTYFRTNGFWMAKRAEVLGEITNTDRGICVAGTHGKTTTSSMTAHLLKQSPVDCNAFLGGILKNYNSNLMLSDKSDLTVIEADEYDRSFHWLHPYMAVITSSDPDHLDIYGTEKEYLKSFRIFTSLIKEGGCLIMKKGLKVEPDLKSSVKLYSYSIEEGDFHAERVRIGNGTIVFDFVTPTETIKDIELGVPVRINIENSIAAMALAWLNGVTGDDLRKGMASYRGAKRRFDFYLKSDNLVVLDDYGHHPEEVKASISSLKQLYPDRKITVIFQPHLFTRTRDFYVEFAEHLSLADELILLEIYPARELPIPGVSSEIIFEKVTSPKKTLCSKKELLNQLRGKEYDVVMTLGAGDIDTYIPQIIDILQGK